jgi:hypothetical protein
MLIKLYWSLWIVLGLAAVALFAAGSFTMLAAVFFGFAAFGLTFMGMISVLPVMVSHPSAPKAVPAEKVSIQLASETPARAFNILKSA